jgi:hypothetical protein
MQLDSNGIVILLPGLLSAASDACGPFSNVSFMSNEGQRLLGCSRRSLAATFLFVCAAGVSVTLLVFSSSGERTSVSVPETVSHGSTRLPSLKFSVDAPSPADVTGHLQKSHLSSLRSRTLFQSLGGCSYSH